MGKPNKEERDVLEEHVDTLRRSFLSEIRHIEKLLKRRNIDPIMREYFVTVRRSRLQAVRGIEKQRGLKSK